MQPTRYGVPTVTSAQPRHSVSDKQSLSVNRRGESPEEQIMRFMYRNGEMILQQYNAVDLQRKMKKMYRRETGERRRKHNVVPERSTRPCLLTNV